MEAAVAIRDYLRELVARLAQGGWRPVFGWLGVYVAYFSYIVAPDRGLDLDYGAVNTFLGFVSATFLARGVEKEFERKTNAPAAAIAARGVERREDRQQAQDMLVNPHGGPAAP
jgi:hypothetical protein